jgi:5-methylthioribose kinase
MYTCTEIGLLRKTNLVNFESSVVKKWIVIKNMNEMLIWNLKKKWKRRTDGQKKLMNAWKEEGSEEIFETEEGRFVEVWRKKRKGKNVKNVK